MINNLPHILLIDDSSDIADLIRQALESYFEITHAPTLTKATELLKKELFDLLLIDVILPDGTGFDFCAKLEENLIYKKVPKFILSGRSEPMDKVYGFNCGADDYITKPFNIIELKARIERHLARVSSSQIEPLHKGDLEFVSEFQKCYLQDEMGKHDLSLTPTEFRLLWILTQFADRVLSRQEIEKAIWEDHGVAIELRGIDTHIAHLRKKLGPLKSRIVSVYGTGYSYTSSKGS